MVSTTSSLVIETNKEDEVTLEQILYIYYPLWFQKDTVDVRAIIDSGSEINVMTPVYALKIDFKVHYTNVGAKKIDGSTFETFGIVLTSF